MKDLSSKVTHAAGRLCLAQASLADEKFEKRRAYLDEIIEKELSGLTPEERAGFLEALADHFPVPADAAAEPPPPAPPTVEEAAARIRALSLEQQEELFRMLGRRGEPSAAAPPELEQAARDLAKKLGIEQVNLPRLCELLGQMASFTGALEQMAWSTWQILAPASSLKRTADLAAVTKKFVAGDGKASLDAVRQDLDKLRKLLAALTAALGHVAHHLAHEHFARIAPAEIENLVGVEGGGFLTSRDVKCWRKYVELSEAFAEARLEQDIKTGVVKYVESLMKVAGR